MQAREYIRKQKIPGNEAWRQYCASGNKPDNIPSTPGLIYKGEGWTDWYDFLGTQKPKYLSFPRQENMFVNKAIQDIKGWNQYLKSGKKPDNIPAHPDKVYKGKDWTTWPDFLGIQKTKYLSFLQAKEHVHKLGLPNQTAWREYCRSGKKRKDIPSTPDYVYKGKDWTTWPDFLGTQTQNMSHMPKQRSMLVSSIFKVDLNGSNIASLVRNLIIYQRTQKKHTMARAILLWVIGLALATLQLNRLAGL